MNKELSNRNPGPRNKYPALVSNLTFVVPFVSIRVNSWLIMLFRNSRLEVAILLQT